MNKSWKLIPKIVSGKKTIESRWYGAKRAPWNRVRAGDIIYFKNAGEPVVARAAVSEVLQFEVTSLEEARAIIEKYGAEICLVNDDPTTWNKTIRYCILMRLENPESIAQPFAIRKQGFGSAAAWMTVHNIDMVRV